MSCSAPCLPHMLILLTFFFYFFFHFIFQRLSDSAGTENLPESSAVFRKYKVSQACITRGRIKPTALEKRQMLDITVWESGQRAQQDLQLQGFGRQIVWRSQKNQTVWLCSLASNFPAEVNGNRNWHQTCSHDWRKG